MVVISQINLLAGLGVTTLYLSALMCNSYPMAVVVTNLIFVYLIIYCLRNLRRQIMTLVFCASIMFFFLGQPTLSCLLYDNKFTIPINSFASVWWGINSAFLALIGILLGSSIRMKVSLNNIIQKNSYYPNMNIKHIQKLFGYLCYFALFSNFYISCKKMIYMLNYGYIAYFADYDMSDCNFFARFGARSLFLCLSIYLATLPSIKKSIIVLILYILSMIPSVIGGGRGSFMLAVAFSFIYTYIRMQHSSGLSNHKCMGSGKRRWQILLIITGVLFIYFADIIGHIRMGETATLNLNPFGLLAQLIFNQSTTFCLMANAFSLSDKLEEFHVASYTLGPIFDTLRSQYIARLLFDTPSLAGQSMNVLLHTQNLSHHISYLLLGDRYFDGVGVGSSYLLELYLDSGVVGILIFNIVLGIIM